MSLSTSKPLHWTQRIALVRHNLHAACRSGDFTFFKALQAAGMMNNTNHFATLSAMLGDEADSVLASLDSLNEAMGYMHQDAFQSVYDNAKNAMRESNMELADKSKLYADVTMLKNKAEMAIDKLSNSAIVLINQQPTHVQDEAANVYITGLTIVTDCVEVVVKQLDSLDQKLDDSNKLEESWNTVKASVTGATTGLKGVFYMLDNSDFQIETAPRSASMSGASSMFHRISNAFSTSPSTRSSSVASAGAPTGSTMPSSPIYRTPSFVYTTVINGCPASMSASAPGPHQNLDAFKNYFQSHKLSAIPPTPADVQERDPFDTTDIPAVPELPAEQTRMSTVVI